MSRSDSHLEDTLSQLGPVIDVLGSVVGVLNEFSDAFDGISEQINEESGLPNDEGDAKVTKLLGDLLAIWQQIGREQEPRAQELHERIQRVAQELEAWFGENSWSDGDGRNSLLGLLKDLRTEIQTAAENLVSFHELLEVILDTPKEESVELHQEVPDSVLRAASYCSDAGKRLQVLRKAIIHRA